MILTAGVDIYDYIDIRHIQWDYKCKDQIIYIYKEECLSVCLFVCSLCIQSL
jgi:hypothetical protein